MKNRLIVSITDQYGSDLENTTDDAFRYLENLDETISNLKQKVKYTRAFVGLFADAGIKFKNQGYRKEIFATIENLNRKDVNKLNRIDDDFHCDRYDVIECCEESLFSIASQFIGSIAYSIADTKMDGLVFDLSDFEYLYSSKKMTGKQLGARFSAFMDDMQGAHENAEYDLEQCLELRKLVRGVISYFEGYRTDGIKEHAIVEFTEKQFADLSDKRNRMEDIFQCERMYEYSVELWGEADNFSLLQVIDGTLEEGHEVMNANLAQSAKSKNQSR